MSRLCLVVAILSCCCLQMGQGQTCLKKSSCSCWFPDNKVIDLTPLASKDGHPRFLDLPSDHFVYSFNPCYNFSEGPCDNVAICQRDEQSQMYYNLGTQNSATFTEDQNSGDVVLMYTGTDKGDGMTRISHVKLHCTDRRNSTLQMLGEVTVGVYEFQLSSPYACKRKPSNSE